MKKTSLEKMLKNCDKVSQLLKSLSHPVRLKVLCQVIEGEKAVNELTKFCGISQSAMSQFLGRMKAEGVLNSRKEGTSVLYSLSDVKIKKLIHALKEMYC